MNEVAQGSTSVLDEDRWVDPELVAAARQTAGEGLVLLANDGTLPLADGARVALFGRVQRDWIAVGYGSGGDVNAPYLTTLADSLRELGRVQLDEDLAAEYDAWCRANPVDPGEWGSWPRHYDEMPITRERIQASAANHDVAVVSIGRAAGEDRENALEPGSYLLTDDERALLTEVTAAFQRTVVLVASGNVMDLSWAEELPVNALVFAWLGGMEGARALADALCGVVEPGGRLTDTIARDYSSYPSAGHFGAEDFNEYVEDVYVGYRWFETFAPQDVQYCFGHGLGYTSFDIVPGEVRCDGDRLVVTATVTNTGARPGREVVQAYLEAPVGRLGRPSRELFAFAKTDEVQPGQQATVELATPLARVASYDDAGVTGHRSAWVLEAGEYVVHVGHDVRQTTRAGAHTVAQTTVVEQCEEAAAADPAHPFQRVVAREGADGARVRADEPVPTATRDLARRILDRLPKEVPPSQERSASLADVAAGKLALDDFIAQLEVAELDRLAYGDVFMDSPLGAPGNAGAFGGVSEELRARGIPPVVTTDGPSGIRVSAYASLLPCGSALASSWNPALVEKLASLHGQEMLRKGSDILLAPGMNIHRDPLCGRNFEYYSEDPLLTGLTAAAHVRGIQSQGVSACPKHFACNNQETNRIRNDSRLSERALREIYLKGFRICVEDASPQNIMTSYNLVNGVWGHYHYDLVTTILRGEWGYAGNVMTDWWMRLAPDPDFPALRDSAYRIRAGVDVLMPGASDFTSDHVDGGILDSYGKPDGITLGEMQQVARHVLGFVLASGRLDRGPVTPPHRERTQQL